jgi:hypothetical protein
MKWLDETLDRLSGQPLSGYLPAQQPAAEPTALVALALQGHGRREQARRAAEHLSSIQSSDGSIGVQTAQEEPGWPTSLAVVAWQAIDGDRFRDSIRRACEWIIGTHGEAIERNREMGHNTELIGWPWVTGTHSWLEPSGLHVVALKCSGLKAHERTRTGVDLIFDRVLPSGGCNYGNTIVLGQVLRPHVQPTGIALLALANEPDRGNRKSKSAAYLRSTLSDETTPSSLGWALAGLDTAGVATPDRDAWIAKQANWVLSHDQGPHKLALLALAALGDRSPLVQMATR